MSRPGAGLVSIVLQLLDPTYERAPDGLTRPVVSLVIARGDVERILSTGWTAAAKR